MTTVLDRPALAESRPAQMRAKAADARRDLVAMSDARRQTALVVGPLLGVAALLHALNMSGFPGRTHDEGSIVAQAWAIEHLGQLSSYGFTYEQPPLGPLQLSVWTLFNRAFDWAPNAVPEARVAMLVAHLMALALLWVLARRLGLPRWSAAIAVSLLAISPLAVELHRFASVDGLALPWILAAFVLACSPHPRLAVQAGAGLCIAIAVLTNEVTLVLVPAVVWQLWQSASPSTRRRALGAAGSMFVLAIACYVLYATVRGELVASSDGPSLVDGVRRELFEGQQSGSLLDAGSLARGNVVSWWELDPITPILAAAALPVVLLGVPKLRPVALALVAVVLAALPLRNLPATYVLTLLPFAALVVAGAIDRLWSPPRHVAAHLAKPRRSGRTRALVRASVAGVCIVVIAAPTWAGSHRELLLDDRDAPLRSAQAWLVENVRRDQRLIVDEAVWVDLVEEGFQPDNVLPFDRADADPRVHAGGYDGWRSYHFILLTETVRLALPAARDLRVAVDGSSPVAEFGHGDATVEVRQIWPAGAAALEVDARQRAGARRRAGSSAARNPALQFEPTAARALRNGEVDERLLTMIVGLAAEHRLAVADFVHMPGEAAAGAPSRAVEISAVDGRPARLGSPAVSKVRAFLDRQRSGFRPTEAIVVGRSGMPVLRITYPIALPALNTFGGSP